MPLTIKGTSAGGFTVKGTTAGSSNIKNYLPSQEAGVFLWLRGDLGITLSSGKVSAWTNQGTAGGSFTQATAARQPTYNASGQVGWPSLTFSVAAQTFIVNSTITNATSDYTFFFACNPSVATSASQLFLMDIVSGRLIFVQDSGASKVAFWKNSVPSGYQGTAIGTTGAQVLTFELINGATSSTIYRNGSSISTNLTYDSITVGGNLTLGAANTGGASWFAGDMFEIIGVNNTTVGVRQKIEGYLKQRYSIT